MISAQTGLIQRYRLTSHKAPLAICERAAHEMRMLTQDQAARFPSRFRDTDTYPNVHMPGAQTHDLDDATNKLRPDNEERNKAAIDSRHAPTEDRLLTSVESKQRGNSKGARRILKGFDHLQEVLHLDWLVHILFAQAPASHLALSHCASDTADQLGHASGQIAEKAEAQPQAHSGSTMLFLPFETLLHVRTDLQYIVFRTRLTDQHPKRSP